MLDFRKPIYFQTNASLQGFGAVCSNDWFAGAWTASPSAEQHSFQYFKTI